MNTNETNETATDKPAVVESTGSKFYSLLVNLGLNAVVAAAIVGAVYAALVALGVLALPGCTATIDLLPDGEQHFDGSLVLPQTVNPTK